MSIEYIIITILSVLLFISIILSIFLYFKKNLKNLENKNLKSINRLKLSLEKQQEDLAELKKEANYLIANYENKLLSFEHFNYAEIEKEIKNHIFQKKQSELNQQLCELEHQADIKAKDILINAMQHLSDPLVREISTTTIKLDNDFIKGKIIGKKGRNKRSFEYLTGVDLIIEKDDSLVTVSCHNPIRREVAVELLSELVKLKSIEPSRIETTYNDIMSKFEQHIYLEGQKFIEEKLKIFDLPKELYSYVGRLKYRSSYGQNTLQHIWECTQLAETIAKLLEVDSDLAIKSALIHDIGKSVDYEINQDHVTAGLNIAKKLNLGPFLINAIESHHGQVLCNNIYSEIVAIVDSISASRPGARINSYEEYIQRVRTLEEIVNKFDEVNSSYAIRSGRQLRVIVNPSKIGDNNLQSFALKIKNKLESDELISGYNIKVVIIKENRFEFETDAIKRLID